MMKKHHKPNFRTIGEFLEAPQTIRSLHVWKKSKFWVFFLIFDFFQYFHVLNFSLKFIPMHNIMNNVVSDFQRILLMYRGSAMTKSVFFCNYSVLKWFLVYFRSSNFFFVFPWAYINSRHHEIDFYKNSSQTTDI